MVEGGVEAGERFGCSSRSRLFSTIPFHGRESFRAGNQLVPVELVNGSLPWCYVIVAVDVAGAERLVTWKDADRMFPELRGARHDHPRRLN